ncbi:MAG: DUF2203 domain-containing protein [Candidatus Acidiferrales bacterium]
MSDEEPKLFTLKEAERTRVECEPLLLEAMQARKKISPLVEKLSALSQKIQLLGGIRLDYERAARVRAEHDALEKTIEGAVEKIHSTGCLIKDLDGGLLDFPARLNDQAIYYCWRLGEDRIRFYHSQDEGFAGRKPIDPRDAGFQNPIQ